MPILRRRTRRISNGFTLVELVAVMAMLSLLAGVAVPTLSWLAPVRGHVAATRLRTTLIFAQEWALFSGNRTWVALDAASDVVSVYVEDPANPGKANRQPMLDPLTRSAMTLQLGAEGVGLELIDLDGTAELEFDNHGVPHDANGFALGADGNILITGGDTLRVTRGTGLVTIL